MLLVRREIEESFIAERELCAFWMDDKTELLAKKRKFRLVMRTRSDKKAKEKKEAREKERGREKRRCGSGEKQCLTMVELRWAYRGLKSSLVC